MEVDSPVSRYQAWPDWLKIALAHAKAASEARKELTAAVAASDADAEVKALEAEFHSTLVAVSASAFSLDAFYASIVRFAPVSDEQRDLWAASRAGRAVRVFDAVRRCTKLTNAEAKALNLQIKTIYRLRNLAVHPDFAPTPFVVHNGLRQAVPNMYVNFQAENAHGAFAAATEAIMRVTDLPISTPELAEFVTPLSEFLHEIVDGSITYQPNSPLKRHEGPSADDTTADRAGDPHVE